MPLIVDLCTEEVLSTRGAACDWVNEPATEVTPGTMCGKRKGPSNSNLADDDTHTKHCSLPGWIFIGIPRLYGPTPGESKHE